MRARDSSSMFSWCCLTLLLWGFTTVFCLVNHEFENLQFTTPGYHMTVAVNNDTDSSYGDSTSIHDCGNKTQNCNLFCDACGTIPIMDCLSSLIEHVCLGQFKNAMRLHNNSDWCIWSNVRSAYNNFTICTEEIAECLLIPWPNPLVEQTFLKIHSDHFSDCPTEELSDPPPTIVFALVMTPICLIPVMVVLVVLKTKNGDGSS